MTPSPEVLSNRTSDPEPPAKIEVVAFSHGVTGQTMVFSPGAATAFRKHYAQINRHYAPVGPIESFLADQIAHGMWRLQRASAIEEGLFAIDAANDDNPNPGPGQTWLDQQKAFGLLITYENRIRRALERDKAELIALQSDRQTPRQVANRHLVNFHPNTQIPTTPVHKQSVFSKQPGPLEQFVRDALKTGTD